MRGSLFLTVSTLILLGCSSDGSTEVEKSKSAAIDSRFTTTPIVAMKVSPSFTKKEKRDDKKKYIKGYEILSTKVIDGKELQEKIQTVLSSPANYGGNGAKCFDPGMAFQFGEGEKATEVVICLECYWAYIYSKEDRDKKELNKQGVKKLANLYEEIFP